MSFSLNEVALATVHARWPVDWILSATVMEPKEPERTTPSTDERKTIDLCGEQNRGARCFRERGHAGQHECPVSNAQLLMRWD